MKKMITEYIRKNKAVSYVELERLFEKSGYEYKGGMMSCSDKNDNVVFWSGWNSQAFNLIGELIKENKIHREPCQPFIYLIDGKAPTYPVVKSNANFKTLHWLPCVFMPGAGKKC